MHAAAKDIPISLYSRIKSLVMFGDGYHRLGDVLSRFPLGLNHKVMQICADGDPVSNDSVARSTILMLGLTQRALGLRSGRGVHVLPLDLHPPQLHQLCGRLHC
jgi:hypothetical protein